ncbi:cytochrome P450 [Nocardia mexicana]|uniref:Cytochrome P450 n=2 Tax=Nocardia mexicana TaxID=279262 RepID=A0A370GID1_9NOCA|nr:cytochrome P450 [Nocardia mexicana]RDI43555.1 cytochrome P450 [Nocardia mexicana]
MESAPKEQPPVGAVHGGASASASTAGVCPVVQGSPFEVDGPRVLLHVPEFAADPHAAYARMRREFGSLVPVELSPGVPATLVIGYRTAVRILNDHEHFPADPSVWQKDIPPDCPVLPMLQARDNALRKAGTDHARLRAAYAVLSGVDLNALHGAVDREADRLINAFARKGAADLHRDYALPLMFGVLSDLFAIPDPLARRVYRGQAMIMDGIDAAGGELMFGAALAEAVQYRRAHPGDDLMSRMMAHPVELTESELVMQVALPFAAGNEPTANLISNALWRLLSASDVRGQNFADGLLSGSLSTRDAVDEVLFTDPPLANFCISYPRQATLIGNVWLPAHQPVVVSLAACNNDPAVTAADRTGNRSHLAYGLGVHRCPAIAMTEVIATRAIDQILDALPEMRLATPPDDVSWRPGIFHRALAALPVVFEPVREPMRLIAPPQSAPKPRTDRRPLSWHTTS